MPMAPFKSVDFNSRISALRAVGAALGVSADAMPSQSASAGDQHCQKWFAKMYGQNGLSNPYSLDYGSFTSAINKLVAKVP